MKEWMDKGKPAEIDSLKWHDSSVENYLHMQGVLMIIENIYYYTCDAVWRDLYIYQVRQNVETVVTDFIE